MTSDFPNARRLTPGEMAEIGKLGSMLEDLTGEALEFLKRLGTIKDYRDLRPTVDQYMHKKREADYPDWWVLLKNDTEVEIECKNLGYHKKAYTQKTTDTPFWAYDQKWMLNHVAKLWNNRAKKVVVLSSLGLCTSGAASYLKAQFDGVVGVYRESKQVTELSKEARDFLVIDLYELFEKWVYK